MKSAIFIFDGITQVVLTPECDLDRRVCELIEKGTTGTMRGSVYECRGGWVRFKERPENHYWPGDPGALRDGDSLIVRVADKEAGREGAGHA